MQKISNKQKHTNQTIKFSRALDGYMVRSRNHIAEMNAAIHGWAQRRWANLKKLATGDASAFTAGSASYLQTNPQLAGHGELNKSDLYSDCAKLIV